MRDDKTNYPHLEIPLNRRFNPELPSQRHHNGPITWSKYVQSDKICPSRRSMTFFGHFGRQPPQITLLYASRRTNILRSSRPKYRERACLDTKMVDSSCSTQWQISGDILQRDDEKFRGVRPVLGHSVATLVFVEVDGSFFTKVLANQ